MQRRSRYIAKLSLVFFVLPIFAQATCTADGYTVVFVNGIFNTEEQARQSGEALQYNLGKIYNKESVVVRTGYNPSHLEGLGDLAQIFAQSFGASVSNFDRDTILLQIHPEVTTRKVFLVGHSQGTLYTNDMYSYLLSHGEPKGAVGVFNVATPANYVAGGGSYLTSKTDFIIKDYIAYANTTGALPPLQPNAQLDPGAAIGNGHNFIDIYLTYAGEQIVKDIQQGLSRLKAGEGTATGGCFTPPENGLGYKTQQVLFAVADPAATGIKVAAVTGWQGASIAVGGIKSGLAAVGSAFGYVASAFVPAPRTANLPGSHDVVGALYGSSVTEKNLKEFGLLEDQAGAVALAVPEAPAPEVKSDVQEGVVLGAETEDTVAPPPAPAPQGLDLPPLYSVGGGGSAGFGGGGSASAAPAQEVATVDVEPPATTTETVTETATTTETTTETATTTETVTESATTTEAVVETATTITLYEQLDTSTLGGTRNERGTQAIPAQKLGTGLSGVFGSIAYKVNGSAIASDIDVANGYGGFVLYSCFTGSYALPCSKVAESSSPPQMLSQSGNDVYLLATTTSVYTFSPDPNSYYFLQWSTAGDWALYGAASTTDAYANGIAEWKNAIVFEAEAKISDVAFRICSTAQCVLP